MDALLIDGPAKLKGTVVVSGSKNTALPFLFTSLLFDNEVRFTNVPRLWDIETTLKLVESMGVQSSWNKEEGTVSILPTVKHRVAPYEWVRRMRAGILALGPLVARFGEAKVSLPGGCAIGARPVNFHLDAMRKMGVVVEVEEGYIKAKLNGPLRGAHIQFPQVTVTGTENLLILTAVAQGKSQIDNAAQEPEVVALGELLNRCGAKISGLGTSTIHVEGGHLSHPTSPIEIPSDRIEGGTWIAIAAATRSELVIDSLEVDQLASVIQAFTSMGVRFHPTSKPKSLRIEPSDHYKPIELETSPYPGFPTDMQAQLLATLCLADGKSCIRESIFENRFMHVAELHRMGARITIDENRAIVEGPVVLQGAPIMATDLRASASLVVAGLSAVGQTQISRIYHLDRGYQRLDRKLSQLGARIQRIEEA